MAVEPALQIEIEIVCARADAALVITLKVPAGTTARGAIVLSDLARTHPEIDARPGRLGLFGRVVDDDSVLRDGDRLEIYRPLIADPKQARRTRAGADPENA